jgi:hypothetical protein
MNESSMTNAGQSLKAAWQKQLGESSTMNVAQFNGSSTTNAAKCCTS